MQNDIYTVQNGAYGMQNDTFAATKMEDVSMAEVAAVTADPLPANWMESIDEQSGRVFYINVLTNQTSWDRPAFLTAGWTEHMDNATGMLFYYNAMTQETTYDKPLPEYWCPMTEPTYGSIYYYNTLTHEISWVRP